MSYILKYKTFESDNSYYTEISVSQMDKISWKDESYTGITSTEENIISDNISKNKKLEYKILNGKLTVKILKNEYLFFLSKIIDEYYIVQTYKKDNHLVKLTSNNLYFKCDQLGGLIKCINDCISGKIQYEL